MSKSEQHTPVAWLHEETGDVISSELKDDAPEMLKGYDVPLYKCPVPNGQVNLDGPNHTPHTGKMAPEGWQPVNTAPRDGTRILLHDPTRHKDKTLVGYFARGHFLALTSGVVVTPTHWVPLPATPSV